MLKKQLTNLQKQILAELIKMSDRDLFNLRHEVVHSMTVLDWVLEYEKSPSEGLQVAALLHDCDRYVNSRRVKEKDFNDYNKYKKEHAKACADIAGEILTKLDYKNLINKVTPLIEKHEIGDTFESEILMNCDSISYFDKNIIDYYSEKGEEKTKKKIKFMYQRMNEKAKEILINSKMEFKNISKINDLFCQIIEG